MPDDQDTAMLDVVKGIKRVIQELANDNPRSIPSISESHSSETKFDLSPEDTIKPRDRENIELILSTLHIPTLQDAFENELPRKVTADMLICWEHFHHVKTNKLFHIYDQELSEALNGELSKSRMTANFLKALLCVFCV